MSNEELVKQIQQGINTTENMEMLYMQNKGFIHSIAKRYQAYESIEDLMQEAYFGLYEAVKRYEDTGETLFITYAGYWIKATINRYVKMYSKNVRIPMKLQEWLNKYNQIVRVYEKEFNRNPTDRELLIYMDVSEKQLERVKESAHMQTEASLQSLVKGVDGEIELEETIESPDNVEEDIVDRIYQDTLRNDLQELISNSCDETQAKIINMRYGQNMTLQAIGNEFGVTRELIRQKENKALRRLRSGKYYRRFLTKYEDELCLAWKGGVNRFNNTWTSSTERAALAIYERNNRL